MNRTSPPSSTVVETRRANDNYGCVLVAQPDQSQGRPITTAGSRPIVSPRPARPVSPEAPRPGARTLREGPSSVQAALLSIFMQVQPGEAAPRSCVSDPNQSDQPSGIGGERRSRVPSGSAWRSHPRVHKSRVINGLCALHAGFLFLYRV